MKPEGPNNICNRFNIGQKYAPPPPGLIFELFETVFYITWLLPGNYSSSFLFKGLRPFRRPLFAPEEMQWDTL